MEQNEATKFMLWHYELGLYLTSTTSPEEAIEKVLKYVLKTGEIEAAGVYLVNRDTGRLELKLSSGLSPRFIELTKEYSPDNERFKIVEKGVPLYKKYSDLFEKTDYFEKENLDYLGIIPIKYADQVIGSINTGSKESLENNLPVRTYLETIMALAGAALWRIETERDLLLSRSNFKLLFDSIDDFILIINRDEKIIEFNPVLTQRLGYANEELRGMHFMKLFPVDRQDEVLSLKDKIAGGELHICNIPFITKSGEKISVETRITLGEWNGRDVIYAISRDITERIEAYKKLQSSEASWKFALVNLSNGMWKADLKTGKVSYSEKCLEFTGYSKEDIEGTDEEWRSAIHPEDITAVMQKMEAHIRGEEPLFSVNYRLLCKDGSYRWISDRGKVISRDDEGNPEQMIGIFIDISLQKKMEDSLKETLTKEKELNELKSEIVSMASHEFRVPLATMLMAAESLSAYWEQMTNEDIQKKLTRIRNKIQSLKDITEKILDVTRLDMGIIEVKKVETDLNKFLYEITGGARITYDNSHIIKYKGTDEPLKIKIDQQMIREVINNLLHNSIKYSGEGTTVNVELNANSDDIEIAIADKGIGIPTSESQKIFRAFYRASNAGNVQGTGLGLALAQKFVKLHEGEITFKSEAGKGSTFFVRLPKK